MDLVFVGDRCCDHSPSSGYDQVCALFPAAGWLSGRALAAGRLSWYREPGPPGPLAGRMFHVFYGDCSGSALPAILRDRYPGAVIVSSVHQPVGRLREDAAGWAALAAVDAIITVSAAQAGELAGFDLPAPVHVVPHGVWTRAFRPGPGTGPGRWAAGGRRRVLLVGNYLRDWDATNRILAALARQAVTSVVVGSAAPGRVSVAGPHVQVRSGVGEAELAGLYQEAAVLLLPVLGATASNALLEAMAAGCPVVCPALPSLVDEYLGDRTDSYPPGEDAAAVTRVLGYVTEPARRAARARVLMKRAERFDWARLRPCFEAAYREIARRAGAGGTSGEQDPGHAGDGEPARRGARDAGVRVDR